jgi:hypothetical protein
MNSDPSNSFNSSQGFPWFEENNFSGWLVQFQAHLRRSNSLVALQEPRPLPPVDAAGQSVAQNNAQRQALLRLQSAYDQADNYAFSDLMKACRLNAKTKALTETGEFTGAYQLITRLKARYNNIDSVKKASHLLKYHSLSQQANESGADYVDRERKEFLALKGMGVVVDDNMRLTKFIQDKTTNSQHQALAKTIYSTPQMTLSKATSLFEGYEPVASDSDHVVAALPPKDFCVYCKKAGHLKPDCLKLKAKERGRDRDRKQRGGGGGASPNKKPRYPCGICDSTKHSAFQCPLKKEVKKCVQKLQKQSNWGKDEEDSS